METSGHGFHAWASRIPRKWRIAMTAILAGGLSLAAGLCALSLASPFAVAAYGLSAQERAAIDGAIQSWAEATGKKTPKLRYDDSPDAIGDLTKGSSRADLVVFKPGLAAKKLVAQAHPLEVEKEGMFSSTVRWAASEGRIFFAAPLFMDHLQLACNPTLLAGIGLPAPYGTRNLEKALAAVSASSKAAYAKGLTPLAAIPLLVPGADDTTLVLLVSTMIASAGGPKAYDALAEAITRSASGGEIAIKDARLLFEQRLPSEGGGTISLAEACAPLASWVQAGYIPADWLKFDFPAAKSYVEAGSVAMLLAPLSYQRGVQREAMYEWENIRFMPWSPDPRAPLPAPLTVAAVMDGSRHEGEAILLRDCLLGAEGQFRLAERSGEAPAVLSARAPDVQGSSVKNWAIQSDRTLQGLALDSGVAEEKLAAAIRAILETAF